MRQSRVPLVGCRLGLRARGGAAGGVLAAIALVLAGQGSSAGAQTGALFGSKCRIVELRCRPQALVLRDLNGDGKLDAVVGPAGQDSTVVVLMGDGRGGLARKGQFAAGWDPAAIAAGDLDGDGHVDLVVANRSSRDPAASTSPAPKGPQGTVSILRGAGDGSFTRSARLVAGAHPSALVVEDLNADGRADIAVLNAGIGPLPSGLDAVVRGDSAPSDSSSVMLFLARAKGGYQSKTIPTSAGPVALAAGDLNGDRKIDLALVHSGSKTVSILMGGAAGKFAPALEIETETTPLDLAIGDLNGDGRGDLVVSLLAKDAGASDPAPPGGLLVALGTASGGLQPRTSWLEGVHPAHLALGDLNGDHKLDVVAETFGSIAVLPGNGDGTLAAALVCRLAARPLGQMAAAPAAEKAVFDLGDVDTDGKLDVIIGRERMFLLSVLAGNGDGTFGDAREFDTGPNPSGIAVADCNGDGRQDIAVSNAAGHTLSILLGQAGGGFAAQSDVEAGEGPGSIQFGDPNGDGKPDLVMLKVRGTFSELSILRGRGDGGFDPRAVVASGIDPSTVLLADVNGDRRIDLVVPKNNQPLVLIYLNKGDGSFGAAARVPLQFVAGYAAAGDLDGDGRTDLVVATNRGKIVSVLLGKGDATFTASPGFQVRQEPGSLAVADIDRDGKPDLVVGPTGMNATGFVLAGSGGGAFGRRTDFEAAPGAGPVNVLDLDADGKLDLFLLSQATRGVVMLRGNGDGTFQPRQDLGTGGDPSGIVAADLNGDGRPDLAVANREMGVVTVLPNRGGSAN